MNLRQGWPAKAAVVLLGAATLLSLAACGSGNSQVRQVVEKSGTRITVMENTSESVYTKLKLEGIDKLEGMRGMDWVTEDQIAVDKENRTFPPEMIEGQERYPHNLYLHDLPSGEEKPLLEGKLSYGFGRLSADKKHMFYKEVYESTGIGYIMNLETGASVKTGDAEFMADEGVWSDDEHVIYPNMEGNIMAADVQGGLELAVDTGVGYVHNVVQSGSIIYYISQEDSRLTAYDTETGQSTVLKQSVVWAIPSPDGSRMAIVKRTKSGEMVLVLCDSKGNEQSTLAAGQQIFGTSWSPDGSKLAYTTTSGSGNESSLLITEIETGEQTPVWNNIQVSDKLRWSPSGKKLLASAAVLKDNKYEFMVYVIRLS